MGSLADIVSFQMMQPLQNQTVKGIAPVRLPPGEEASSNMPNPGQNFAQAFQEAQQGTPAPKPATPAQAGMASGMAANDAAQNASLNANAVNSGLPPPAPAPAPAPMQSDETTKINIAPATKQVDQFFNQLGVHSYQYKDKKHGEGTHFSVMAQELESAGPVGKSMVIETSEGKKVDYGRGLAVFLAGLTNHNKRIKELERLQRIKGRK